jgi:hypothetical protein
MNTPNVKDAIQFLNGPKRGLLAQVVAVADGGKAKCLSRDMDGTPHFFELSDADQFTFVGVVPLGPKPNAAAEVAEQKPALPPPLDPQELLEPLPPEVKVQPINPEPEEPPPVLLKPKPYKPGHRSIRPTAANPFRKPPRPEVQKRPFIATVKNALDEQAEVTVNVRLDDDPNRHKGVAFMRAGKVIQNVKPFTLLGWKLKE